MIKRIIFCILILSCWQLMFSQKAMSMHISEGILPFNWAVFWFLLVSPFLIYGVNKLKKIAEKDISFKTLTGLSSAIVFVISCMPVPVPVIGSCSHPTGVAISAILLGPGISFIVASCALLLQALFLAHGGLSTLGANIFSMGIMGSLVGYSSFKILRKLNAKIYVAGFVAGVLADWVTYIATSVELALGIKGSSLFFPLFAKILISFIPTQLPLGILEGALTGGFVVLLLNRRPDLLEKMKILSKEEIKVEKS